MRVALFAVCLFLLCASKVPAQTPFYQGKQIKVIVGFTTGGFYDRWARLLPRYMPKHIPGSPEMIVQNMPGADSVIAAIEFGRPIIAGPGTAPAHTQALRQAFEQSMKDPELLADAQKQKMDVDPESGENLEKLVTKTMNQPADVIARVKKLLGN